MPIQIEDILTLLCSKVTPHTANDFQKVFMLGDRSEARLAYDVLLSHGFDVKLYHDTSPEPQPDISTLYITNQPDSPQLQQRFASAMLYAQSLKPLKKQLDALWAPGVSEEISGYSMSFTIIPGNAMGKQIVIQINAATSVASAAAPAPVMAQSSAPQSIASPVVAQPQRKKKKKNKQPVDNDFRAGPKLTQQKTYPGDKMRKGSNQHGFFNQIYLYVRGNSARAVVAFIGGIVVPGIILYTIGGMVRGMLCPDFASVKRTVWYCNAGAEDHKPHVE